jgi:CheY-like chemotaxis protein
MGPLRSEETPHASIHPRAVGGAPEFVAPPQLTGIRALIVDDERDSRELIIAALSQCGAEAVGAANTVEALTRLSTEHFDLLVSDIGMPGEDGYALIRKVRAFERDEGRRMPAVALTAFARGEDRSRALAAGFDIHVSKPVEPSELVLMLGRLIDQRAAPVQAPA